MSSSKPRKQRLLVYKAPYHRAHPLASAHLTEELRKSYKTSSLPIREGDTVLITRGDYKGISGRVLKVDRKRRRVEIDGVTRERADGRTVRAGIHPSKVVITRLNLDDRWRLRALERKAGIAEAPERPSEKPAEVAEARS